MPNTAKNLLDDRIAFGCLDATDESHVKAYLRYLQSFIDVYEGAPSTADARIVPGYARGGASDRGNVSDDYRQAQGVRAWDVLGKIYQSKYHGGLIIE